MGQTLQSYFQNKLARGGKLNGEVVSILVTSYEDATRKLQKTAAVEFNLNRTYRSSTNDVHSQNLQSSVY